MKIIGITGSIGCGKTTLAGLVKKLGYSVYDVDGWVRRLYYKKDFIVEIYNDKPIYCVKIDGEKRYIPYFEANYYFTNIDDCKKRMDTKNVAVVDMNMYGFLMNL